jgi:hypothetical protein
MNSQMPFLAGLCQWEHGGYLNFAGVPTLSCMAVMILLEGRASKDEDKFRILERVVTVC